MSCLLGTLATEEENNTYVLTKYKVSQHVQLQCYGVVPLVCCVKWATLIESVHLIIICWRDGKQRSY